MVEKKTRIAFVRQRYRCDGGAERFVARVLQALGGQAIEPWLIARSWPEGQGFSVIRRNPFHLGRLGRDRGFSRAVQRVLQAERFDLVQSHERIPGVQIFRAGDGVHREWLRQRARLRGPSRRVSAWHRYLLGAERELFAHPKLRAVLCNSTMVKDEIQEHYGLDDSRLQVILNGVDTRRFRPPEPDERRKLRAGLQLDPDHVVTLFVGSGFERKGLKTLVEAVAPLPEHHRLLIVGKDSHSRRYEKLAADLGFGARGRFLGPPNDPAPLYRAADIFALPTLYDPFPNVVFEAMASGLAVVTSTKSGGREIIDEGVCGHVVDALDTCTLAAVLETLAERSRREAMGKAARERALLHDDRTLGSQLRSFYSSVLKGAS